MFQNLFKRKQLEENDIKTESYFGMRHFQVLLLFLDITIFCINRMNAAVTIVAMTNAATSNPDFPEYDWDEKAKSYILSSFYWGYVLTQIPGGYLVRRFGVKLNLFICTFSSGILSLIVPFCMSWGGWEAFCFLRFLQGFVQGGFYSGILQSLAKWSLPEERSRFSSFIHMGFDCGIVLAMGLSGVTAASPLGWPGVFYISAGLCFIWCIFWLIFGANDITDCKFISITEKAKIETSLKDSVNFENKRLPIPWRAIFTSMPFYALLIVRSASEMGFFTIQTEWPTYLNAVLKMDIKNNALFSALPALFSFLFIFVFAYLSDFITKHCSLSETVKRKSFNSIAMWVSALCIVIVGFLDEEQKVLAIFLMTWSMVIHGGIMVGSVVCTLDIAPNHTNVIVSIINMMANLAVMLGPLYAGLVVTDERNRDHWLILFATLAAVFCIGDTVFLIWGTAKEQPWNAIDFMAKKDEENKKIDKLSKSSNLKNNFVSKQRKTETNGD